MRIPTLPPNVPADGPMVQPPFVTLPEDSTQNNTLFNDDAEDNIGSLYYVVAVIFIYGFSIVLMIASHIRKNQQDNQLRTYLKEMALLRKKDRREKILGRMTTFNTTNVVCSNLHNTASGTGALTSGSGSGQPLITSGNGSISRTSAGCTFPHISSCPYGIHVATVNVAQNHTNTNSQSVSSHGHYPKNSQPSFLHECVVNCTNPPLVPAAPPPAIDESSAPQCESNCSTLPVASFDTVTNNATNTATSNNGNNNCTTSSSSSSSSSNSSSVSTTAITAVVSTPLTSSATSNDIISTTVASVPACDSAAASSLPFAKCLHQQQQNYMNHPQKIDEAQEIMLLQTQLTQIQLHQKQQQQQQQQQQQLQQQQPNNRCVDPIVPLEPHCVNEKANQENIPNETNNKILSENVIT